MSQNVQPDSERLDAIRGSIRLYFKRKQMWTKILFAIACCAEIIFFGLMFLYFDFENEFYWFIFWGLSFIYCPLVIVIVRNSIVIDRLYYRLLLELKYNIPQHIESKSNTENHSSAVIRSYLSSKDKWVKYLMIIAGCCEAVFGILMIYFMDFKSSLNWFMFFGFIGVYSPLVISSWRNTFAIDRIYYGLLDELKYS